MDEASHVPIAPSLGLVVGLIDRSTSRTSNGRGCSRGSRKWQILLKKSFLADEREFSGPLMRSARGDARDTLKNDFSR